MRNKVALLFTVLLLAGLSVEAQRSIRIGYIDMDYILENVPEYQEAQTQLDSKVNQWKTDIEKKSGEIEQMKKTLENERVLLTQELIDEREEEISFMEGELLKYQQDRFGPRGDLMIQRSNLVEPVQDQVFNAVQEISKNRQYDFVFDKSAELVMLYANERHDISDQVLLSITRASKRTQVNNRADRDELERDESRTVEQEREVTEREREAEAQKTERQKLIDERKAQREADREAKQKAFDERRQKLLEDRQRRKDSILEVRRNKRNENSDSESQESNEPKQTAEERRQQILQERQRRKDSILEVRQKKKDSVINARKNNTPRPPGADPDGNDGDN
tara:strand:- start:62 stop:1069 length:1008 start_codon:yes stop_codon:yes gene_type:complete